MLDPLSLAMGYLAPGEITENMLQLKRSGLHYEGVLNRKWLISYRNYDISYRNAMGLGDMHPGKIFK